MPHRRKRRTKKTGLGRNGRAWFMGIAALMLVFIIVLIVPSARHKGISTSSALDLALLLWVCSLFATWACLRSRRRRYTHGEGRYTTRTDYSGVVEDEAEQ